MRFVLVDTPDRTQFYPFTLTRSLADCRVGIYTFKERWEQYLGAEAYVYTVPYLQPLYTTDDFINTNEVVLFINITCIPNPEILESILNLKEGEKLVSESGKWIATKTKERSLPKILMAELPPKSFPEVQFVKNVIHLLSLHAKLIARDFSYVQSKGKSQALDNSNKAIQADQIFIEEGATILCSNLNASEGPIYIGKEAVIMEGVSIRGPFVLGQKAVVKMNTSIYGSTTIGPNCLAGGEIKNSIIMGYSNKGHEGYLGDSIIGFWCNLGAGTSNSNIKNTAGPIQMWNEATQVWETVGQKMGMLVGDYSRFAIQSSVNTGSYIGVSANIFGNGLLPKNIPNFTWGTLPGYQFDKVVEDINNWKKLKGLQITEAEKMVLKHLHQISS
jgi:UDP-N-acetylglucosamine diphosphorylase/glucosamine-1-phosphate N-acetyltransferase